MRAAVIGSGVGGMAIAIRMAVKGYKVTVFEQSSRVGGKLNELRMNGFRFDTGPSLFTMPDLVDELFGIAGNEGTDLFSYQKLENVTRYFYPDGKVLNSWADPNRFAQEAETILGEPAVNIQKYLSECSDLYRLTSKMFIFSPFPTWEGFKSKEAQELGKNIKKLKAFETMHKVNSRSFSKAQTVQLFNRFATYNGSNPYKAPGTLTIIPHLEHNVGAYFPERGMYSIAEAMQELAIKLGVKFELNCLVQRIDYKNNKVIGIMANGASEPFDIVVNNTDIFNAYPKLMPEHKLSWFYKRQKPSSSALIFYWGVKGEYSSLDLHNILFSADYPGEFKILEGKGISTDPTVYIFISSKMVKQDAPKGHENWFVMVNAPADSGQDWDEITKTTRTNILKKIKKETGIDIEPSLVCEDILTPPLIEHKTGSYRGALYGISSNNKFAAFSRHPNRSKNIDGLYFTGGSVHPGGGIPLCLASAKIVDNYIKPI
ncbi:MAG: phytoene desaturase family protein [Bacteroidales bacterium]|nr:phytoene desaturase family protein [Bacteroidales bacterium]MDD4383688.1 phytoene desaturase family protein [Bacteroidales bacterium]MDY0196219.1 1-hydroxycarotenoid 3,4-desaturase CrtD [Tenuifilaceae bacterium]